MSIIPFEKSFASHEKAKYWSDKNDLTPNQIFKSTHSKFWFNCDICKHTFESALSNITKLKNPTWCPYCANLKLCNDNNCKLCFEKSFASHEKSKYWNKEINGDINPRNVVKFSNKKYWFNCQKCNHIFESAISGITSKNPRWCNYCVNRKLCEDDNCKICFEKSFASHEKSNYWNKEKNGDVNPRKVFKCSKTKCWFDCMMCKHTFESMLNDITSKRPTWCPYCSVPCKLLCDDDNCKICFEKSFVSHEKSNYWNKEKNGDINPRKVFKCSNNKYWFNCDNCKHAFESLLSNITHITTPEWCPYCGNKKLCDYETCNYCFENSFASHEKSQYWNTEKNGDINPRKVFKCSSNKYWFDCDKCNLIFESTLNHITNINKSRWCPNCVNKTELKLHKYLLSIYPTIISQFKQEWCKKVNYLPFDFCIPEYKIIIELDGPQHFVQISNWTSPEKQFENDKFKEECANNNGYSIIRLLQEDVINDKYDWAKELCNAIKELENGNKIANIYLCKNNEYINF
jgi:very-short-patch-repair endonuclease/DNA-directed RNA polymerase subunit RPC12/RpoP